MATLAEELRARQTVKVVKFAEEFAEKIETSIVESAEKGYSSFLYHISSQDENKHILHNSTFIKKLDDLLEDVKVTLDKRKKLNFLTKNRYYEYYIVFSWKEDIENEE